jgi:DNA-binding transcriptional LysR family regulator
MSRKISLNQLDAFNAVVRLQGITAAAGELHLTQPAISISIKHLEAHFETPLLEMVNKKITPTAAGRILFRYTQTIKATLNDLDASMAHHNGEIQGDLTIAMVSTAKYFIPNLLSEFLKDTPKVNPKLFVLNRQDVLHMIEENSCDFAVMSQVPTQPMLVKKNFCQNPLVMIAAPKHPLAKKQKITIEQLKTENLIVREEGAGIRASVEALFKKQKINPNIKMELSSTEAIKKIVSANMGIGLVPRMSISHELESKRLCILNVDNTPINEKWHFVHAKGKKLTPLALAFMQHVTKKINEYI